jgi:hypothetical protein
MPAGARLCHQNVILAESWRILEPGLKLSCVLSGVWKGVRGCTRHRFGSGVPAHVVVLVDAEYCALLTDVKFV